MAKNKFEYYNRRRGCIPRATCTHNNINIISRFIILASKFLNSGRQRKMVLTAASGLDPQGSPWKMGPSWGSTGTPVLGSRILA